MVYRLCDCQLRRLHEMLPSARLVVLLRDPVSGWVCRAFLFASFH